MIIELYGLPGSGKTTLARKLAENHLVSEGFAQKRYIIKFIIRYPLPTLLWGLFLLHETFVSGSWSLLRYKMALLGTAATHYIKAREAREADVVIDEGFIQRLLSVAESVQGKKFLSFMITYGVPRVDTIYIVQKRGDDNNIAKRYNHVDHPRTRLGDEYLSRWHDSLIQNNKIIEEIITSSSIPHSVL